MSTDELRALQSEAKRLARTLAAVASVKLASADFVDTLTKALKGLPEPGTASDIVAQIQARGAELVQSEKEARARTFRSHEADFVRSVKGEGTEVKELNSSWRIGPIEIEVRAEASQARCRYNREPVTLWRNVASSDDLRGELDRATLLLEKSGVPSDELIGLVDSAFEDAYRHVHGESSASRRIPILALLRSIRIERWRQELATGDPGKPLRNTDMPKWALLYNLDRYRELIAQSDTSSRIQFETGSQHEQSQGKSVVLNGLYAAQDYQVYAHAVKRG